MMTFSRFRSAGVQRRALGMAAIGVVSLSMSARPAHGQDVAAVTPVTQAARPYRGLFGAGTGANPGGHLLALTATVYQEYGNNQSSEIPSSEMVLDEGWFLGVRGQLAFEKAGRFSRIGVRGETSFRYIRDTRETTSPRARGEIAVDAQTGSRKQNQLRFSGSADYEPYYILSIFPTEVAPTGDTAILPVTRDDLLFKRSRAIYGQAFSYEQQLSRRSYFRFFEDWRLTQASDPVAGLDVNGLRAGARYGYRMTPHAALQFGYAYRLGNYGLDASQRFESHDIDASIEYRKPITRSRTTTFGFGAGSSRVSRDANPIWLIVGSANVRHQMGAGWFVQADFSRNTQLVEGFARPFLVNTVTGSVGGFLGHRVEVLASGGYSRGLVGFDGERYSSRQGSARLRWALAKYLAIDAEGLLTQFGFGAQEPLPGILRPNMDRWSVRCNIAWWLPLSR